MNYGKLLFPEAFDRNFWSNENHYEET